jgi:hypothetical protein
MHGGVQVTLLTPDERDELRETIKMRRLTAMTPEAERLWDDLGRAVEDSERCGELETKGSIRIKSSCVDCGKTLTFVDLGEGVVQTACNGCHIVALARVKDLEVHIEHLETGIGDAINGVYGLDGSSIRRALAAVIDATPDPLECMAAKLIEVVDIAEATERKLAAERDAALARVKELVDAADAYTMGGNHTALFDALDAYHNEEAK